MAIRTRAVYPDQEYQLPGGEIIGVVSLELLLGEVAAAVQSAHLLGGIVQVIQDRARTGVPNEMVTVGALIQWQDRTDAKPQPEPAVPAPRIEEPEVDGEALAESLAEQRAPIPQSEEEGRYEEQIREAGVKFGRMAEEQAEQDWRDTQEAIAMGADIRVEAGSLSADPEPEELEAALEQEAVVIGAPVGARVGAPQSYAPPEVHETPISHTRPPREEGVGAGALPFQRGGEPGVPPEVNLADIAHGSTSAPERGATPAPAGSSEGIDDGFVPEADEDDSSIPESFRG